MRVSFVVLAFLATRVSAQVDLDSPQTARILRDDRELSYNSNGIYGYGFRYDTSDGTSRVEEAQLRNNVLVVRGQYSYLGPDGKVYTVTYIADENGFRAEGVHLPKVP